MEKARPVDSARSVDAGSSPSWLRRNEFLVRRLHSLSGLIPVGAFMVVHLTTNASVLAGAEVFQGNVDKIHGLGPLLPVVEWAFIFAPILFHAILGVVIIRGGLTNTAAYPYGANVRYTLQRATGMIAFVFIVLHVLHMHHYGTPLGSGWGRFDPHDAAASASAALTGIWVPIGYAVGMLASVFHLANGIWTMGITWGVWISPAAQQRANYICATVGVLLAVIGLSSLIGMKNVPPTAAAEPKPAETAATAAPTTEAPTAETPTADVPAAEAAPAEKAATETTTPVEAKPADAKAAGEAAQAGDQANIN